MFKYIPCYNAKNASRVIIIYLNLSVVSNRELPTSFLQGGDKYE
ncbi:MAG TPA: hypothetical protein ACFYD7_10000 [Candidatus Wujingus californicus]|nr:hypothetical protein [Candidatus Brocadiales bacterium]